jgi:hypothetical protein
MAVVAAYPEAALHRPHSRITSLDQGYTLACGLRPKEVPLGCAVPKASTVGAVTPVWSSEFANHDETALQGRLL